MDATCVDKGTKYPHVTDIKESITIRSVKIYASFSGCVDFLFISCLNVE